MTLLLLQVAVVLLTTLVCGWAAGRLGQPRVIGEIAGGIALGPSLLGRVAPHASASLFPHGSLGAMETLSTVGLVLFLFLVGYELDEAHLRRQGGAAFATSLLSILLPFALAAAISPVLEVRFGNPGVGVWPFTLFLGISMSITAFPVLARILEERGIQASPLGVLALLCAAVDDVCAWMLLAGALTLVPSAAGGIPFAHRLGWLAIYLVGMLGVVRPVGVWWAKRGGGEELSYEAMAGMLVGVIASAAATDAIGVHPLFGAFVAGVCLPRQAGWQHSVRRRLEVPVSAILLPLFFALTGLRTRIDLLDGARVWAWTGVVLAVAVAGKMGGAVVAARWIGQTWRDAFALGALLNTRGLVELIVLNVAYDAGVFSPTLFTMLVVMALVTTMMTAPLLNVLGLRGAS